MRKLNTIRKEKGMSAREVSEKIGVTLRYYRQMESGERTGQANLWDSLEDIMGVHQRILRETTS